MSRAYERFSFAHQIMLASGVLLAAAMMLSGMWLGGQIERSTVNRVAAVSAAYVESILAAQLRGVPEIVLSSSTVHDALDHIFVEGPLRRKIVAFRLWDSTGVVHYSNDHAEIGRRFPVGKALAAAFGDSLQAHIGHFTAPGSAAVAAESDRLLEVHVPLHLGESPEVVGVAQFYHRTGTLDSEVAAAQQRSWAMVAAGALVVYGLLFGMVRRASNTITRQRDDLRRKLEQLVLALHENEHIRQRLGEAGAATTALNEQFLHRVAADLHDGPAQSLAFLLLRFDEVMSVCGDCTVNEGRHAAQFRVMLEAVRGSLDELRGIATGLGVPGIDALSLADTAGRAIRDVKRRFDLDIAAEIAPSLGAAELAVRITVYRLIQESLTNSIRHAPHGAPKVKVWADGKIVWVEVADRGPGFDPQAAALSGRLGLALMEERVRLLGGVFELHTAISHGTRIRAGLPLNALERCCA